MKFLINGYWKDDKSEFSDYVVSSYDDNAEHDDEIFYFGLNESDIKEAIKDNGDDMLEFVITSYTKLKS
jgi:hypothetical protein